MLLDWAVCSFVSEREFCGYICFFLVSDDGDD